VHPTEKAVSILKPLIETFSRPGNTVLDPFCGSGRTLVAASLSKRHYLGIEIDSRYSQFAEKRLLRAVLSILNMRLTLTLLRRSRERRAGVLSGLMKRQEPPS
jgi:DNA modification methylase